MRSDQSSRCFRVGHCHVKVTGIDTRQETDAIISLFVVAQNETPERYDVLYKTYCSSKEHDKIFKISGALGHFLNYLLFLCFTLCLIKTYCNQMINVKICKALPFYILPQKSY